MSRSSFNFTQALNNAIEYKELQIDIVVESILQRTIENIKLQESFLSKETLSEIFFIQTDGTFEDYYEYYEDGEDYEQEDCNEEEPSGDRILVAVRNIHASLDQAIPFIEIYHEDLDSAMEAAFVLTQLRKKLVSEELETIDYFCKGAINNGKSFAVRMKI